MKLRRVSAPQGGTQLKVEQSGQWLDVDSLPQAERDALAWLAPLAPATHDERVGPLPFQPASFRDCSLYEKHWIQSSRGYVKRFLPGLYPPTQLFERLSGRTFPAFLPHELARRQPIYYFGNHLTIVPSGTHVACPEYTRALDYELELGLVLSRPLLDASPAEALHAIGGFVVVNDWSARDVQRKEMQSGLGPQKSKHFLSSMSQTLVTADELLPRIEALDAFVELNGARVAQTSTRDMAHSLGAVLAFLSRAEQLYPGELIATGTLPDGSAMENGHWVRSGDVLRLVIEPIGEIVHTIT